MPVEIRNCFNGALLASLSCADLRDANLCEANLCDADLCGANLYGANLYGANLYAANLCAANLRGANLCAANLCEANLCDADLCGANLCGANLYGANLYGADLRGAKGIHQTYVAPESGAFVAWKQCRDGVIVKLQIPAKAKRSNATGRKCRAEYVKVLAVYNGTAGVSHHDGITVYRKGETVRCSSWEENRWIECGGGIHFFMTRQEAEEYVY